MMFGRLAGRLCLATAAIVGVSAGAAEDYAWILPAGFPLPSNGTQSCGTCDQQARAFTAGRGRSVGSTGEIHPRGSMSLGNVAYATALTWANPTVRRLEDQALVPMYGEHPIELGLTRADRWLEPLRRDDRYQRRFLQSLTDDALLHDARFADPGLATKGQ